MASSRIRSRWKLDSRKQSTVRDPSGGLKSSFISHVSTLQESMTDFITADWARLKRDGFVYPSIDLGKTSHLRDAAKHGYDARFVNLLRTVPPVNALTYTATRNEEESVKIIFNLPPTVPWLITEGPFTQMMEAVWGSALPVTPSPSNVVSAANLMREAKSQVLTQCADTSYSFGEPMAEIRETLRFIRSPMQSLRRLMTSFSRDVERRRFSNPGRHAKNVASAWAEYRFAAAPLVRTADDALAASADYFHKKSQQRYIRFAASRESSGLACATGATDKNFPYFGYNFQSWRIESRVLHSIERHCTAGIKCLHTDSGSLASLVGLRGRDIPLILWQTFPLSFMFDRLYDVSSWLQASSNFLSANVRFAGGWETARSLDRVVKHYTYIGHTTFPTINTNSPRAAKPWNRETFTMTRLPWVPTLSDVRPPAAAGRLVSSLTSTADLVAITVGRVSRTVRKQ